ncbi:MAG: hypothetical protein AABY32_02690 [Nanoarchaeota archaeon]
MKIEARLSFPDKPEELIELLVRAAEVGPSWKQCEIYLTPLYNSLTSRSDFRKIRAIKDLLKLIAVAKAYDREESKITHSDFMNYALMIAHKIANKSEIDVKDIESKFTKKASTIRAHDKVTWKDNGSDKEAKVQLVIGDRILVVSNGLKYLLPKEKLTKIIGI